MNHVRIMTGVGAALMAWQTFATPVAAEPISFREYQMRRAWRTGTTPRALDAGKLVATLKAQGVFLG